MATLAPEQPQTLKPSETSSTEPTPRKIRRSKSVPPGQASMPTMKKVCYGILGLAALLLLLFLIDLFTGFPFAGASTALDIFGILACGVLGYLAWDTAQEIR